MIMAALKLLVTNMTLAFSKVSLHLKSYQLTFNKQM
jgi:hypothetical protein